MRTQKSLAEVQKLIQESVRSGSTSIDAAVLIAEKPPISVQERFKIYQEAYRIRLLESLRDDFPNVEGLLGSAVFEDLALQYIRQNPSRFQNLALYSEAFPGFVNEKHPMAGEQALKEWMEILSVQAADPSDKVSLEYVQSGKDFKIKAHPSAVTKDFSNYVLLSHRNQGQVFFRQISSERESILIFLAQERTLQELSEFCLKNNLREAEVVGLVSDWIQNEIIYCLADKT